MQLTSSEYFDAMLYGVAPQQNTNFFQEQAMRLQSFIPENYHHVIQDVTNAAARHSSHEFREMVSAVTHVLGSAWEGDRVRPLTTTRMVQAAPQTMIRTVMAHPDLRRLYWQQECEGYGDKYVDMHPKAIGDNHPDYQRVYNGMVREDEEGNAEWDIYLDADEDDEMLVTEQVDSMVTMDTITAALQAMTLDPTSPWGGKF